MCLTLPRTMITLAGIEKVLPRFAGSRSHAAGPGTLGYRRADESLHFALDRRHARRWTAALSRRAAGQRPLAIFSAKSRAADAAMHSLRRLHEHLPGLPADRRTCVWFALCRPDRRDSDAAARCTCSMRSRCPMRRRCAAACYEVCPVKINIPEVLIELRAQVVDQERAQSGALVRSHVPRHEGCEPRLCQWHRVSGSRSSLAAWACVSSPAKMGGFTAAQPRCALDDDARSPRVAQRNLPRMVGDAPRGRRTIQDQARGAAHDNVFARRQSSTVVRNATRTDCEYLRRPAAQLRASRCTRYG